jgi:hypothetical protein
MRNLKKVSAAIALILLMGAGSALAAYVTESKPATAALAAVTTTTVSDGAQMGDFTYDGQTIPVADFGQPFNNDNQDGKVWWVKTPFAFDCAAGSLAIGAKHEYRGEQLTDTFVPPGGTVLVGVIVKSGTAFSVVESTWLSDGSSATVEIDKGYSASAVFYCTPAPPATGTIVVRKATEPAGGLQSFEFTPSYAAAFSLTDGQSNTSAGLAPGVYSVAETPVGGWTLESATCSDGSPVGAIDLASGETVTCTFTNTPAPAGHGTIVVKKVMVGGTDTFSFTGAVSGSISVDGGALSQAVEPDDVYAVAESPEEGWALTSITCDDSNSSGDMETRTASFHVEGDETVTCTFTNTKQVPEQATLIVRKVMVGGTATFAFTGDVSGSISESGGSLQRQVDAATYTSIETKVDGWKLTGISCSDSDSSGNLDQAKATFVAAAGEEITCTFTNVKEAEHEPETVTVVTEKTVTTPGATQTVTTPGETVTATVPAPAVTAPGKSETVTVTVKVKAQGPTKAKKTLPAKAKVAARAPTKKATPAGVKVAAQAPPKLAHTR